MSLSAAALGCLSRSASRVVTKAANGFHLLRIDGYSQNKTILPGQMLSSQDFNVGGRSWRINYYPNGRATSAKSNSSVYLQLIDGNQRLQQARYKFSLLDHAGNAAYELPAETGSFISVNFKNPDSMEMEEPGPGCGHEEFIGREELEKRCEDLIRDDRIVLRCDVGVTQIDRSYLAHDDLSEEEDLEYGAPGYGGGYGAPGGYYGGYGAPRYGAFGPPRRRRHQRRTDDDEYIKWCLTQEPGQSLGRRQVVAHGDHDYY